MGLSPLVAQVSTPEVPQAELIVERVDVVGEAPRWVHGEPTDTTLDVTIGNDGGASSLSYDLYFYYEVRGERTYLNGERTQSWDRENGALNPGVNRTHEIPWRLQPEHHGNGRLVVVIEEVKANQQVANQVEHPHALRVPVHEVGLDVESEDQVIRPFETRFVRVFVTNHGNIAEEAHLDFSVLGDEVPGLVVELKPEVLEVPAGRTRFADLFVHYDFEESVGSAFNTSFQVDLEVPAYGGAFNVTTPNFVSRQEAMPAGSPGRLDRLDNQNLVAGHGEPLVLGFRVMNVGGAREVYTVDVRPGDDWIAQWEPSGFGLDPGESGVLQVHVEPTDDALRGSSTLLRLEVVSNRPTDPVVLELPLRVQGPLVRVEAGSQWAGHAYVGDPASVFVRVHNDGDQDAPWGDLVVSWSGSGIGEQGFVKRTVFSVSAGGTEDFRINLGQNYSAGGPVFFSAEWERNPFFDPECDFFDPDDPCTGVKAVGLDRQVMVHDPKLSLHAPDSLTGQPGEAVGYRSPPLHAFVVHNEGTTEEVVRVEGSASGGNVGLLLDENPFALAPGESRSVPLDHRLPLPSGTLEEAEVTLQVSIAERSDIAWSHNVTTRLVDENPPRIQVPSDLPGLWTTGQELDVVVRVTDDSRVESVRVLHTDPMGVERNRSLSPHGEEREHWVFSFASREEGNHSFVVVAEDYWGNMANHSAFVIDVQTVAPPRLTLMGPNEGDVVSPEATFQVGVEDYLAIHEVTATLSNPERDFEQKYNLSLRDGVAVFRLQDVLPEPLPEGNLSVLVEAVNVAGARDSVTRLVVLQVPEVAEEGDEPELQEGFLPVPGWVVLGVVVIAGLLGRRAGRARSRPATAQQFGCSFNSGGPEACGADNRTRKEDSA